jgi:hypothetical protein
MNATAPSPVQVLEAWERGLGEHLAVRALTMLSLLDRDSSRDELEALPVGERDGRLLTVHERLFGPVLSGYADCPGCGTPMEFRLDTAGLRPRSPVAAGGWSEMILGDLRVQFRVPTSSDLLTIANAADVQTARRRLAERCVGEVSTSAAVLAPSALPEMMIDRLSDAIAATDTGADQEISLQCADCGHAWTLTLDIVSFLWAELNALAKRLLHDVHVLAWAYGWREADILSMSEARRRWYVERVA